VQLVGFYYKTKTTVLLRIRSDMWCT